MARLNLRAKSKPKAIAKDATRPEHLPPAPLEPTHADNPSTLLIALVAFVVPCLLYASSASGEFAFDDERGVVTNRDVRSDTPWANLLKHDFWGTEMNATRSHKSYRPLTVATFKATNILFGLHPAAFHGGNILFHATTCSLFATLAVQTLGMDAGMAATALFVVHPIHTEAVSI